MTVKRACEAERRRRRPKRLRGAATYRAALLVRILSSSPEARTRKAAISRSRDDQSLAGSRESKYHTPLRGDLFGDEAGRAHESQTY